MPQQGALDDTSRILAVDQQLMEHAGGEGDVDLYTDVQENGHERRTAVSEDESPQSLSWVSQKDASPPAVRAQSNGITSLPFSPAPLSPRESVCVSTLNCQVTNMSGIEPHITRSSSSSVKQRRRQTEESHAHSLQAEDCRSEAAAEYQCSCLQAPHVCYTHCKDCDSLHDITCAFLTPCKIDNHRVVSDNRMREMKNWGGVPQHDESFRVSSSPSLSSSSAAMSSLALQDVVSAPISYHDCCDLTQLDPQVLCLSCSVFHTRACKGITYCQSVGHEMKQLGLCTCGSEASRNPLVLCRFCGKEYCRDCWYRDPFKCTCGEKFDQSSSV